MTEKRSVVRNTLTGKTGKYKAEVDNRDGTFDDLPVNAATESNEGPVQFATSAESIAGLLESKAVHPAGLYAVLQAIRQISFDIDAEEPDEPGEGTIYWDALDRTLSIVQFGGTVQQVGQEIQILVRNNSGSDIPNGSVLRSVSSSGQRPTVALARADSLSTCAACGIATQDIYNNSNGVATVFGLTRDFDTQTPDFNEGDDLYLSAVTAGAMTTSPPANGYTIKIGRCLRRGLQNGMIICRPDRPPYYGDLAGGNYMSIEADGTVILSGSATVYNDWNRGFASARVPAANAPTWSSFIGNLSAYRFAVNDYLELDPGEYEHPWTEGSEIEIHTHWATNGLDTSDRFVKWEVELTWANMASASPFSAFPTPTIYTFEATIPANTADRSHIYTSIDTYTPTGGKIGGYYLARIRRIAASGAAPTNDPFGLSLGFHHNDNSLGSRTEEAK